MTNLITPDIYKQAKAITSVKDDERLSLLVPAVSQLIKTYCGVSFNDYITEPYTEYATVSWTTNIIQLSESPIISTEEVLERTSPSEEYVALVENVDYVVDVGTDCIHRIGANWPIGVNSVQVSYLSGYTELPGDIKLAAIDLVSYYYKEEHKAKQSTSGASMTNIVGTTLKDDTGFPDHIKRVLDMYRQI